MMSGQQTYCTVTVSDDAKVGVLRLGEWQYQLTLGSVEIVTIDIDSDCASTLLMVFSRDTAVAITMPTLSLV